MTPLKHPTAADVIFDDEWPPLGIRIRLDGNQGERLGNILHELLHVMLGTPCIEGRLDETLEEVVILAMEEFMVRYITKRKVWLRRWAALIDRKVKEVEDAKPDVPLEEQVKR